MFSQERLWLRWYFMVVSTRELQSSEACSWSSCGTARSENGSLLSCGWPNDGVSNIQLDVHILCQAAWLRTMIWSGNFTDSTYSIITRVSWTKPRRCVSGYCKERRRHGIQITLTLDTVTSFKCSYKSQSGLDEAEKMYQWALQGYDSYEMA
jgi:hypothetical protein